MKVGRIATVFRYPVKSLLGETLDQVGVDERGLVSDRLFAVRDLDGKLGSGKNSKRLRRMDGLQLLRARYDSGEVPVLELPDGTHVRADDSDAVDAALSAHAGRPVSLAREGDVSHFDDGPVHLVTTASLTTMSARHGSVVDPRRCRPNLVVDTGALQGFPEDEWLGRTLAIGDELRLRVVQPMPRCVMTTHETADLGPDPLMLKSITDHHGGDLGVLLDVVRTGTVRVGDLVELLDD